MRLGQTTASASSTSNQYSFGASLWEFLHPSQVQAEDVALGQPVPSTTSVLGSSAVDMAIAANPLDPTSNLYTYPAQSLSQAGSAVASGAQAVVAGASSAGKWLVIGLVALAVIELSKHG